MKRALIMLGTYYPKPFANGICIKEISKEMQLRGYEIHIISLDNENFRKKTIKNKEYLYPIRKQMHLKIREYSEMCQNKWLKKTSDFFASFLGKLKKLMYIPFYPLNSPILAYKYFNIASKLHKKHNFDIVISTFMPLEVLIAGMYLKKKNPEIRLVYYLLDTLSNGLGVNLISKKWIDKKGFLWEERLFKKTDRILYLKCHASHYCKKSYDPYKEKMDVVDIPLFTNDFSSEKLIVPNLYKEKITIVYAGALSQATRNPKFFLDIFKRINQKNIEINFYSRGDCEDLISSYKNIKEYNLIQHGYVEANESKKAVYNADLLISIGNSHSDMIPSKIFEYMSTGKKVIHFYINLNDPCVPYYNQYNKSLLINELDSWDMNIDKIKDFINKSYPDENMDRLSQKFYMNKPSFTVDLIEKEIKEVND